MTKFYTSLSTSARLLLTVLYLLAQSLNVNSQPLESINLPISDQYIVVYKKNASVHARMIAAPTLQLRQSLMREEVTATLLKNKLQNKKVLHVYETALKGFSIGGLTEAEVTQLRQDDQIAYIVPDNPVFLSDHHNSQPLQLSGSCNGPSITLNGVINYTVGIALFGSTSAVTGQAVLSNDGSVNPTLGCGTIQNVAGKIAVIDRGICLYSPKAYNAQLAGAIGVIILNSVPGGAPSMAPGPNANLVTIPVLSLSQSDGILLKAAMAAGTVTAIVDPQVADANSQCKPWGISRVGGGASGVGKRAWVIDTGVDLTHPDLNVNTSLSTYFIGTSAADGNGHGTHVAGTIAAKDNGIGVIGVAAGAEVVAVKVFPDLGSTSTSVIIAGINYVTSHAAAGDVANLSLGGTPNQAEDDAVLTMSQVCKVVMAAGNDAQNANFISPGRANGPNIYTVSAMDIYDKLADFSSFGNGPVDYSAPGVNVASCWLNGGYAYDSGTSMAAPHVAGLLLLGIICATSKVTGDPDGNPDLIATLYNPATDVDNDHDGVTVCGGDCDDNDPAVHPGAVEICDNKDNNCDGQIDEGNVCCPAGNTGRLYVKANATGANNGLSWNDAFTSLQSALTSAKHCTQIVQIWVAEGIYYPTIDAFGQTSPGDPRTKSFIMQNNLAIYGGFEGNETNLSQRNVAAHETVLSGDIQNDNSMTNNVYHVIMNFPASGTALNSTAILDGFIVFGGYANFLISSAVYFPGSYGGGMFNYNSSPDIVNCTFLSNLAYLGGGIENYASSPRLLGCSFLGNFGSYGGGIDNYFSSSNIVNCLFQLNNSQYGGGLSNRTGSKPNLTNCSFSGNDASTSGGGIYNYDGSLPNITNSILWGDKTEVFNEVSSPGVAASNANFTYSIIQGGWPGSQNLNVDPKFTAQPPVGSNTLGNLTLLGCSPAVNTGDNAAPGLVGVTTDLEGNNRIFGAALDRGAYELQSAPFAVQISANPGLTISAGSSTTLTASGAATYLWSTTETSPAITVSPNTSTTYSVTGTSGACSALVSVEVTTSPLPVTLISFSAKKQANGSVKLSWVTSSEIDNAYFELERSKDLRQIENLAQVAADEKTAQTHTYRYSDELPYQGTSYYRLRQVDFNGQKTTYSWAAVVIDQTYTVFPNPVLHNQFQLQLDEPEKAAIRLYGLNGSLVPVQTTILGTGMIELKVPKNSPAGIYLLHVEERGQSRQYRLVIE